MNMLCDTRNTANLWINTLLLCTSERRQLSRDAIRWSWTCRHSWSEKLQYTIYAWTAITKPQPHLAAPRNASGAGFWISGWIPETQLAQLTATLNAAQICAQHDGDIRFETVQITIQTQSGNASKGSQHTSERTSFENEGTTMLREVKKPKWRLHHMHHRWYLAEPTYTQQCELDNEYRRHMMTKDNPDEWNTTPNRTSSSTSGRKRLDWLSALETVTDTIMSMFLEN
jgi:hypothetical protein